MRTAICRTCHQQSRLKWPGAERRFQRAPSAPLYLFLHLLVLIWSFPNARHLHSMKDLTMREADMVFIEE